MTMIRIAALCTAALMLVGCMQSGRDLFAPSEKVALPVTGNWVRVSGWIPHLKDETVITPAQGKSYKARGLTRGREAVDLSFVPLEGTGHYLAIGAESANGPATYYIVRLEGADILVMEMGCPAGRIPGIVKNRSDCRAESRAALLAAAYDHMSDPGRYVGTSQGALYRRGAQ